MKNLLFTVIFVSSFICARAQKVYFIYLQSDNYNAFYVKMGDKIYSSAASGYLIIPGLVDSTYNFTIGFPSSQSEFRFVVPINARDRGFLIKNFDTGLGLFDLQNLTIINEKKDNSPKNISYIRRNDEFASLLSRAADDTSLLYAVVRSTEPVMVVQEPKVEIENKTEKVEPVKDSTSTGIAQTDIPADKKISDTISGTQLEFETKENVAVVTSSVGDQLKDSLAFVAQKEQAKQVELDTLSGLSSNLPQDSIEVSTETEPVFKKSQVKKSSESSTSEGFGLIFYDQYEGGQDTIQLLIPNPPIIFKQPDEPDTASINRFIEVHDIKKDTVAQVPIVVSVKKNAVVKSQCKSEASSNDFFKLRKNMASVNTDEAMVVQAKKYFKMKCFTTGQIKNLSALFLTSAGKYEFFDASYLHVTDQENFSSLESEIKDDYYLKRFKALIGE